MHTLLFISTVIDLAAVAALGFIVWRSGREWEVALGMQRAALDSLRADLSQLVDEAERRAQALDETLGVREQRLRSLLGDLERAEPARRRAADDPRDPAEARLLRDMAVDFGARRA